MAGPPILPEDDDPIGDDVPIYRLVPVEQCEPVNGQWIFRSGAFDNSGCAGHENEMSVVIGDTLAALSREPGDLPQHAYPHQPGRWGVAVMKADCVRAVDDQTIVRTQTPEERAHGDVLGSKKQPSRRKALKRCATWVVAPTAPVPG
jgi:hypothetical protein